MTQPVYDLAVVGGGINGAGIAADAAGRGLKVLLVEMGDLGGATSSASSKLIHGGLRYLEQYEFRLVREALQEREVLLARAPHIIWPMRFVLPHVEGSRPRALIRAGLFIYDHLARRRQLPGSQSIDLQRDTAGRPLRPALTHGFSYWDCWVDDARLVVANARAAADRGAGIRTRTTVTGLHRHADAWQLDLAGAAGRSTCHARAIVNAAGPWADDVSALAFGRPAANGAPRVRLVKGSHIVVRRIAGAEDAYVLQNRDGRVVFALPFERQFTIIGTTDVPFDGDRRHVVISPDEESYLLDLANQYFATPLKPADIVWRYAGVRPLYDDAEDNPSSVSRDYRLDVEGPADGPRMLTVLGGKVTTYRRLAEVALEKLRPEFPTMGGSWTARAPLPGGDIPRADYSAFLTRLAGQYPEFPKAYLDRLARRYGSLVPALLGDSKVPADLGADIGGGVTVREVSYLKSDEWAVTAEDILWRRTKAGLHLATPQDRDAAAQRIERLL